jgi:hypothetical protein
MRPKMVSSDLASLHDITVYIEFMSLIDGLKKAIQVWILHCDHPYLIVLVAESRKSFSDHRRLDTISGSKWTLRSEVLANFRVQYFWCTRRRELGQILYRALWPSWGDSSWKKVSDGRRLEPCFLLTVIIVVADNTSNNDTACNTVSRLIKRRGLDN